MNWEFIGKYLPMYEKAALLTVKIGVIGILSPMLMGLVCAAIQYYKVPVLRWIVAVYVELSRNTPLLVQLFFIYYGFPKIGIRMSAEVCGVVGLAFLGGSYMAEAFRSGLEAVEPIQNESAISLGMNSGQVLRYVILPQAMSTSIPAFVANIIFLLNATSVFSAISPSGGILSVDPAAGIDRGISGGEEDALCRIWGLMYYSKARTCSVCCRDYG